MIRSGTTRFWDMYWQPEATARAVADAGLRATIGAPLFDVNGDEEGMRESALAQPRGAARRVRAADLPGARPARDLHGQRSARCAGSPSSPPSATSRSTSTSPRPREEVEDCLADHGERPAAYLDRLGLLGPAHRARPRRLARPRRSSS